ncbi:hypothetical protein QLX67_06475 [Balneolaceae bacterium ANBcel3]|nr:hypothetical protein [Balneolaceae bacterium ANBcel3]
MKTIHYYLIMLLFISSACATSSSYGTLADVDEKVPDERELMIPAGVDSLTAQESRQLADSSFVAYQKEQEAQLLIRQANAYRAESDTLWHYLSLESADEKEEYADDPAFIESFNEGAEKFTEARSIAQQSDVSEQDILRYEQLVDNAIQSFEEALVLNPFDTQTRLILGQLYGVKASRLNNIAEHKKAIDVLEKLIRIEKGEHVVYASLAENYFRVNSYEKAAKHFRNAREALKNTALLTEDYYEYGGLSPQDSLNTFLYSYYTGEAFINLFDADHAIKEFETALNYTSSESDIEATNSQIEFINWDDGNILGSMRRDSLITLASNGKMEEAESGFKDLLTSLKTISARDEIDWRLGVVQYQLGKQEVAVERLLQLVQRTETDLNDVPVDTLYNRYFDDFGTIAYNFGIQLLNQNERSLALKYFNQSTKVSWQHRARSYLQIANLISNNIKESIRFAQLAEKEVDSLSDQDKKALYELLADLHRRNRNIEVAQHYFQLWREI